MFYFVVGLFGASVLAETKVYKVTGTANDIAGLYTEIESESKAQLFKKIGKPDIEGFHYFLFRAKKWDTEWKMGDGKDTRAITINYRASSTTYKGRDVPPVKGWKPAKPITLEVIPQPSLVSTLRKTTLTGGSFTSDGGLICLVLNHQVWTWTMITKNDPRICNRKKECKNGLDEENNCQRKTTTLTPTTPTTKATATLPPPTPDDSPEFDVPGEKDTEANPQGPNVPAVTEEADQKPHIDLESGSFSKETLQQEPMRNVRLNC